MTEPPRCGRPAVGASEEEIKSVIEETPDDRMQERTACEWMQDEPDSDTWDTDCGGAFTLNDGTPSQNRMAFCCYCGKPIREAETV